MATLPVPTQELLDELFNRAIDNVELLTPVELEAFMVTMQTISRLDHVYQEEQLLRIMHNNGVVE